jgi:hypothetical protein
MASRRDDMNTSPRRQTAVVGNFLGVPGQGMRVAVCASS